MTIAYDGSNFHGWQKQPGKRTVQGDIEAALGLVLRAPIAIHGVSRTDAGVHAYGQRAGFAADTPIPAEKLRIALNNILTGRGSGSGARGDIRIREVVLAEEGFHARHDAVGKTYIYKMLTAGEPDIFLRNFFWQIDELPDAGVMRQAAEYLLGTHDFRSFRSAGGKGQEPTVKTIYSLRVCQGTYVTGVRDGRGEEDRNAMSGSPGVTTTVEIAGSGFLYNMVRIIVGTLAEVGAGRRGVESVPAALAALDRRAAGPTAPPQGLYLAKVHYDRNFAVALSEGI